ncbi:hypothetical protein FGO68_gene13766 [Halteria grandinella]|uniref:Uncharacterized protein n=1 Tax=Halteria grandinella TaxID=5974 RepID=A0A8J8T298_HALGN|nr:hypothetical protein FGO68_gene13766 [Halteria grandinella]
MINKQDFFILKVIGRGSFGKVYLVKKKDNDKLYAMKTLKKDQQLLAAQYASTKAEREILEKINHPFIVKLHFAFQTPQKLYFVMDFLNGGELFYHLKREGRFTESRTQFYAAEILLALECLHKNGVIYRDLKPENVLLDSEGHVKLTDFGLSKQGVIGNRNTYTFCGTPEYLAPEIVKGKGHGKAVDWWSLGLMIYEMLSGINPFKVRNKNKFEKLQMILEDEIEMQPSFSEEACSLIQGLLTKKPKQRLGYNGCHEIKDHPFFGNISWAQLEKKEVDPPYRPRINGELDLNNIDRLFTREPAQETPEDAKKQYLKNVKFDNFTYKEESVLNQSFER